MGETFHLGREAHPRRALGCLAFNMQFPVAQSVMMTYHRPNGLIHVCLAELSHTKGWQGPVSEFLVQFWEQTSEKGQPDEAGMYGCPEKAREFTSDHSISRPSVVSPSLCKESLEYAKTQSLVLLWCPEAVYICAW